MSVGFLQRRPPDWLGQEAITANKRRSAEIRKPRRVSELVPKDPLLEWLIRWLRAKPDSQRSLLKRLASYAIDPGVVDQYAYRIAREVEHNAVTFSSVQTRASSGFAINSRGLAEALIDRRPEICPIRSS